MIDLSQLVDLLMNLARESCRRALFIARLDAELFPGYARKNVPGWLDQPGEVLEGLTGQELMLGEDLAVAALEEWGDELVNPMLGWLSLDEWHRRDRAEAGSIPSGVEGGRFG